MQTLQAVIMGAIQGLSEFLPVSSSAHIVYSSAIYKILTGANFQTVGSEEIFFDILIHLATLLAVIIFFFKDLKEILGSFFTALKQKDYNNTHFKFVIFILAATFVTCILAFVIKDVAHNLVENPLIVSVFLMITGCILFFSEKFKRSEKPLNLKTALLIGLAQGLAVFPGLSRSGLTIATGIFNGIPRVKAARFSFILSIPIIILASLIYPLLELNIKEIATFNYKAIICGVITSFVVGYFCIKYFMKFIEKFTLRGFAYYCWIMGFAMIIFFSVFKN